MSRLKDKGLPNYMKKLAQVPANPRPGVTPFAPLVST